MVGILGYVWHCHRIVVDATGVGQPVASFLRKELGSRVIPFVITAKSKSEMGFGLLSFVNSGRLKLFKQDGSGKASPDTNSHHKSKACLSLVSSSFWITGLTLPRRRTILLLSIVRSFFILKVELFFSPVLAKSGLSLSSM